MATAALSGAPTGNRPTVSFPLRERLAHAAWTVAPGPGAVGLAKSEVTVGATVMGALVASLVVSVKSRKS